MASHELRTIHADYECLLCLRLVPGPFVFVVPAEDRDRMRRSKAVLWVCRQCRHRFKGPPT